MSALPPDVASLVERFCRSRDAYRSAAYNETQARREFIDPFFKALGWDIDNVSGLAEAYKDVIHEDAIKVGGATKAPDYCFRIGGTRKFFVEAKKPAVGLESDPEPAYQLRRYAWTSKLPLSILTDFEEFAVYDCRIRPNQADKASAARVFYCTCDEYADKWEWIVSLFSKDAVLKGAFDKYAESNKRKRGTAEVDTEFLRQIEEWRATLAQNFALRNPDLSVRDLNFAVQRTIDRIVFLRMCEDRGIEIYGQLGALRNGDHIYERLAVLFRQADERYNSGLFHFDREPQREPPDELTLSLKLDDRILKDIIKSLYYPESPYEFSVLPAEILGQVYEQFLGKVIRLTAGHHAKVEEKPEVRKAGGVYYTPTYIVDYIVKNTVGKLLEGKTPPQVGPDPPKRKRGGPATPKPRAAAPAQPLRVLDPACGSGSFLLGAYQHLLDWHRDWYVNDAPAKHPDRIYQGAGGQWRLTIQEKKRILLNNIYGVDIDPQAVETTKLSLLLKVLEGETAETIGSTLRLFHERALPDLDRNIKCGNSLIGPDFYNGQQLSIFDDEERLRINVFDWRTEFPEVLGRANGGYRKTAVAEPRPDSGFDAVIGNPPWGQKEIAKDRSLTAYLRGRFLSVTGIFDLFRPFIEQGIALLRSGGLFGMVLPDIVLLKDYQDTRRLILGSLRIERIDWWGMAFQDAVIDAATLTGSKAPCPEHHIVHCHVHDRDAPFENRIPQRQFWDNERLTFNLHLSQERRAILDHLARWPRLGTLCEIHEGVHSGNMRSDLFVQRRVDSSCRELIFGRDEIAPYLLRWSGKYVRLSALPRRRSRARYANAGQPSWYERPKLLVRRTGDFVLAAVDEEHRYASNNFFILFPHPTTHLDLDALCALLNSPLMTWFFRAIEPRKGRVFAELKIKHLERFPIPVADGNKAALSELSRMAHERRETALQMSRARNSHERIALARAVEHIDSKIAAKVFDLFNTEPGWRELIAKETDNGAPDSSVRS